MQDVMDLFNKKFFVIIPYVYTLTEEEINLFGIHATSINGKDVKNSYNNPTRVYIPLWRIVQLYTTGCTSIAVTGTSEKEKEQEVIAIYETLHEIIELSMGKRVVSLNIRKLPTVNLEDINELSEAIYQENKHILVKDAITNPITELLGGGFMSAPLSVQPVVRHDDIVIEDRYSRYNNPVVNLHDQTGSLDLSRIKRTNPFD